MRLIDADALRDKLQAEIDKVNPPFDGVLGSIRCGVRLARNMVEDEPTVDVEPVRHGQWIWDDDGMDGGIGAWICSACHCRPGTTWQSNHNIVPFWWGGSNYCPNCGARMDVSDMDVGKKEEEEE